MLIIARQLSILFPNCVIFNEILTAILWVINVSILRWKYRDKELQKRRRIGSPNLGKEEKGGS